MKGRQNFTVTLGRNVVGVRLMVCSHMHTTVHKSCLLSIFCIGCVYQEALCDVLTKNVMGGISSRVVHSHCLTVPFPPLNRGLPAEVVAPVCDQEDQVCVTVEQDLMSCDSSRHSCSAEESTHRQQENVAPIKLQTIPPIEVVTTCEGGDSGGGGSDKEYSQTTLSSAVVVPKLPKPVPPKQSSLLLGLLRQAVDRRVRNLPLPLDVRAVGGGAGTGARVGILFSGGVDSVVMAALADL